MGEKKEGLSFRRNCILRTSDHPFFGFVYILRTYYRVIGVCRCVIKLRHAAIFMPHVLSKATCQSSSSLKHTLPAVVVAAATAKLMVRPTERERKKVKEKCLR